MLTRLVLTSAILLALLAGKAPLAHALEPGSPNVAAAADAPGPPDARIRVGVRPEPRPVRQRCTYDRAYCIRLATYIPDVCRTIEAVARRHALDPHFFARLLWRESLFEADAISPAGAQGIAQFMPGTAALRGLKDPFNPAEALRASADYLAELSRDYGNIGLAAAAYNGGEARLERFLAGTGGLPLETRAYVHAITGHSAATWRDVPPEAIDLSLSTENSFLEACTARGERRGVREFREPLLRWGVIITSNISQEGAERHVTRLRNRHASVLAGESVSYTHGRAPGMRRSLHLVQIGRDSRAEADALCDQLRAIGGACMVLRN